MKSRARIRSPSCTAFHHLSRLLPRPVSSVMSPDSAS